MAEQLDDGEFWLPSQFLTDDDIIEDFKSEGFGSGFGSWSSSDLVSLTTETETSDDDDHLLLAGFDFPLHSKLQTGSGSPQSTLCGPVSPPKDDVDKKNATLDLLNKAAGEVAKIKIRSETRSTGTGFFDCSNSAKGLLCPPTTQQQPPLRQQPQQPSPLFPAQFYSHPQFRRFPPHMMWGPVQLPPQQHRPLQNRVTKSKPNEKSKPSNGINNRPLGLPPSAWPPLPGQAQAQSQSPQPQPQTQPPQSQVQSQPMMGMYVGPQNVSVGTGVFLPRQVTVPVESKKKSADGNPTKTKNNKVSQRRNSRPAKTNNDEIQLPLKVNITDNNNNNEIQLPSEWVY